MADASATTAAGGLPFIKMHGLGNDYVYVDVLQHRLTGVDRPALARAVSDRFRGIGSDGLILIAPPDSGVDADVRMEMYNADGSRSEMCGNGIRCVAKYAVERGLVRGGQSGDVVPLRVQTDRGVLRLVANVRGDRVESVRVNMGAPILAPREIPVDVDGETCVQAELAVNGCVFLMTCVSMGNPHAVVFVEDLDAIDLRQIGAQVERHAMFPRRVNFHIARVDGRGEATMRTWERGSGVTQACGTGACAVLVAGVLEDRLDRAAVVHLPGGDLEIAWPGAGPDAGDVLKTGPAEEVFRGVWRQDQ